MHTLIDPKNPTYSQLVFSAPDTTNSTDDGVLYTSELFSMSLQSKMAVLSACQTGDGAIIEGEGILSLARGFFYAGVPSVVMTLWSVDDARSALIMESFYKYLKKGYSKGHALRQAKLDLLETGDPLTAHPRFWAGYVSIGNQNPVTKNNQWLFFLAGLILISIAGFVTVKTIQSRRRK
jgi:CHAT domain-containing protein